MEMIPVTDELVDQWIEQYPGHAELLGAKMARALAQSDQHATEDNAPLLEQYAAARPIDPSPHRLLAQLYLASQSPAERQRAIPHLEYLDVREQYTPAYAIELARLYSALKRWDLAMAKSERATQIAPFDAGQRELAATIAIQNGALSAAERHIAALVDLEPGRSVHRKRLDRIRELIAKP
jgi:tetratricopeptide (TPR) repeat protein